MQNTRPFAPGKIKLGPGFWDERLRLNRESTIPHTYAQLEAAGSLEAFRLDRTKEDLQGKAVYRDSDVAKWIEAASHSLATHPDADLERTLDATVQMVVAAQQPDGYLNTWFTVCAPEQRWTNLRDKHELYCAGHLFEAAVAHHVATGKRTLLEAACRYADCIAATFGPKKGQLRGYPGHEEIELALVKLARATGEERYLELARFFLDERGRKPHFFDVEARARGEDPDSRHPHRLAGERYAYYQAHRPVREQTTAEGHAVRAGYLYAGMAEVAADTGDAELLQACRRIWRNIVERRMHIHGGIGSEPVGERFSVDYDLPNMNAYAETCAAIALALFAHRMLHIEPRREYADAIERALFNAILACASRDGDRFFYANRLACIPEPLRFLSAAHRHHHPPSRQPWFGTACCPTNLCRFLPALGQYVYTQGPGELWVHQFINSSVEVDLGGRLLTLSQQSGYPWQGRIELTVEARQLTPCVLCLRLPGWCRKATVQVGGGASSPAVAEEDGYLKIERKWQGAERVVLDLGLPVERVEAHPAVWHNAGRIALQRGPVVFCLEEADNGPNLHDVILPTVSSIEVSYGLEGLDSGIPVLTAAGLRRDPAAWRGHLYRAERSALVPHALRAVPYYLWNNRGEGEMAVWIREGGC